MTALVVFSPNVKRLAAFYEGVLGGRSQTESAGDIRVLNDRDEVLVHSVPGSIAERIHITAPPSPREASALKPIFDVTSLESALEKVAAAGGVITASTFTHDGLTRHDVLDPDGNVIQLRAPAG